MRLRVLLFVITMVLAALTTAIRAEEQSSPAATQAATQPTPASSTATTPAERELGKHTAASIEHDCKLVKDPVMLKKLNFIANKIAPCTQRPDVVYEVRILDTPDLNAESIPGGIIFITRGLLNAVESDDELAGVLAHEIAHNSLHHVKIMMERQKKATIAEVAAIIASLAARTSNYNIETAGPGQFIMMSEMVKEALLNGYTVAIEQQADLNGVTYLAKLKMWNPVGLYSVILGFRKMENSGGNKFLGYLKTHPYADERKTALEAKYQELGVSINLWSVEKFRASISPPRDDKPNYLLRLGDVPLLTLCSCCGNKDAKTRATEAMTAINNELADPNTTTVQQYDVKTITHDEQADVLLHHSVVLTLNAADAKAAGVSLEQLAGIVKQNIKDAVWKEKLKRE